MKRLLIPACVVVAFLAGVAVGNLFHGPGVNSVSPIEYDPSAVFRGKFNEELRLLAFRRAIAVRTIRTGRQENGTLQVEAKYNFRQPLTNSEIALVDHAASKLWELHKRDELVGRDLDVLNPLLGVATHISVHESEKRTRLDVDWDASRGDADVCACLEADLRIGKIVGVNFTASDGRGWH